MVSQESIPLCVPEIFGKEWEYVKDCLDSGWMDLLRWLWAMSLRCLWRALSVEHYPVEEFYRRATISHDSVREVLLQSQQNIELIYSGEAKHAVLGPENFAHLKDEPLRAGPHSFNTSIFLAKGCERQVCGLSVHVILWFSGIFLLPDLETVPTRLQPEGLFV